MLTAAAMANDGGDADQTNADEMNGTVAAAVAPRSAASDVMKRLGGRSAPNSTGTTATVTPFFNLAPFNPSSDQIQKMALEMMSLTRDDVLFDLGCGDGRFLCHAATEIRGLRCVGIEVEAQHVSRARDRVRDAGLESVVHIRLEDATKVACGGGGSNGGEGPKTTPAIDSDNGSDGDGAAVAVAPAVGGPPKHKDVTDLTLADDATALYLFILPKGIVKMMPILESLKERRLAAGKRFRVLSYMFEVRYWEATVVNETAKGSCPVYYYDFGGA